MTNTCHITGITVDLRANTLVLAIHPPLPEMLPSDVIIDIGANGRLLGIEAGEIWIDIAGVAPEETAHIRSATVPMALSADRTQLEIPRRGDTWEISFPSGNQCWRLSDGHTVCSVAMHPGG